MNNPELTRDAKRLVSAAYKVYLERREAGLPKNQAKDLEPSDLHHRFFPEFSDADYQETVTEMCRALNCKIKLRGAFELSIEAISYVENKLFNNVKDIASFFAQFIP